MVGVVVVADVEGEACEKASNTAEATAVPMGAIAGRTCVQCQAKFFA